MHASWGLSELGVLSSAHGGTSVVLFCGSPELSARKQGLMQRSPTNTGLGEYPPNTGASQRFSNAVGNILSYHVYPRVLYVFKRS